MPAIAEVLAAGHRHGELHQPLAGRAFFLLPPLLPLLKRGPSRGEGQALRQLQPEGHVLLHLLHGGWCDTVHTLLLLLASSAATPMESALPTQHRNTTTRRSRSTHAWKVQTTAPNMCRLGA